MAIPEFYRELLQRWTPFPAATPHYWEPIEKGGSARRYYRLQIPDRNVRGIVMEYSAEREENALYADVGRFLEEMGAPVPKIWGHDAEARLIWMEDLGEADLQGQERESWSVRGSLYRQTLEVVEKLHRLGEQQAASWGLKTMPGFDEELYAWERNYCYKNFVQAVCGIELTPERKAAIEAELAPLALHLVRQPQGLVHRDFQSQNIMVANGQIFLIDFQGLRRGLGHYDLASLVLDPYVTLTETEKDELVEHYRVLLGNSAVENRSLYEMAGIQRLMQALGAYGFLGLSQGQRHFLRHIPVALPRLRTLVKAQQLNEFSALLDECHSAFHRHESN
jgi:aminoglycoside/choline kinase family phosphotransferase